MFQTDLLAGRTVLITGGGTGLGRSMALRFAELGAQIFLTARREEPLRQTADDIRSQGGKAAWASCDVRDFAAVEKMIGEATEQFGGVDVLVNNAAGNFVSPTERLSPNAFAAVVGIVLHGSFHCTLALGRRWIETRQPGTVLSILTTYVWTGSGFVVPSACAKAGVLALTRSLAVEWARHRIRLNAIAPGPFPTEGAWSRVIPSPEFEKEHLRRHPMQRFGRHEELTNLAAFLISPQADYINGECVTIDGGQWLRQGGQFNDLLEVPQEFWDEMEKARRAKG
ncbi:MAG TPA: SDR family oxidoreductase [Candidatus Acidoferrales bacterium]|nr:SDR family oxidoreductase [Candidatus Acidoferrales bacterium]